MDNPCCDGLLGNVALRFAKSPEDLATESLFYILKSSVVANQAFHELLRQPWPGLPGSLTLSTQAVGGEGERPDMVGYHSNGQTPLVIEAKFWASLTDAQPNACLKRLPSEGGLLVFLAPENRIPILWQELCQRIDGCGDFTLAIPGAQEQWCRYLATIDNVSTLVALSWRSVLGYLRREVELAGDAHVSEDVRQLEGLCQRMNRDAFSPLRAADLSPSNGKRMLQFQDLVDDAYSALQREGLIDTEGVTRAAKNGRFGYCRLNGHSACIGIPSRAWFTWADTPIWFRLWDDTDQMQATHAVLKAKEVTVFREDHELFVPIYLETGLEYEAVLANILQQVRHIADVLPDRKTPIAQEAVDPDEELT